MKSFRTRIKVCGMTSADQVAQAVALGVDAIGIIIHADSPRTVSLEQAKSIRAVVPAFVQLIGVSVNAEPEHADFLAVEMGLDLLQLHGDEDSEYAENLVTPYLRAIRAKSAQYVDTQLKGYESTRGFLLDPYVKGVHGGTGQTLSLDCWPSSGVGKPLILAGGLGPDNLFERVLTLNPFAVDLNSGVENAPGDKNLDLLAAAILNVKKADAMRINSD